MAQAVAPELCQFPADENDHGRGRSGVDPGPAEIDESEFTVRKGKKVALEGIVGDNAPGVGRGEQARGLAGLPESEGLDGCAGQIAAHVFHAGPAVAIAAPVTHASREGQTVQAGQGLVLDLPQRPWIPVAELPGESFQYVAIVEDEDLAQGILPLAGTDVLRAQDGVQDPFDPGGIDAFAAGGLGQPVFALDKGLVCRRLKPGGAGSQTIAHGCASRLHRACLAMGGLGYDDPMIPVSAVIITFNEERDLPRTLAALTWADEILVVDSGSTDATVEIASAVPNCRVLHRAFDGYGPQKRYAVSQAAHDWVFSVDADEVVTPALADSVRALLSMGEPSRAGYEVPRRLCFLGREFRFGRESNAPVLRLFDRRRGAVQDVPVHERVEIEGPAERLGGSLIHYSYRDLDDYFDKFNQYTTAVAHKMRGRGKTASALDFIVRLPVAFFTYYFVHGNVLNGFPGFVWSVLSAYYRAVRYLKLYELERLPPP